MTARFGEFKIDESSLMRYALYVIRFRDPKKIQADMLP